MWVKEDNKAATEISKLMDEMGAFNAIVDNIQWHELFTATGGDEVYNYETQYQ